MKLFTRYFRINILATVTIFLLASLAFFFLLRYVSIRQVDDDLRIEQREVESFIARFKRPPEPVNVHDQTTSFELSVIQKPYKVFRTIKSPERSDEENYRQLQFTTRVGDQWLLFKVSKSLEETENLIRSIIFISLVTIITILIVSLLINRWLLRRLWKPFYATLGRLEKYRLGGKVPPAFEKDPIHEFNLLNHAINRFITEAEKEFYILKEFTENASHELQTPVAIIRSSLEVMMQDESLTESLSHSLLNAHSAVHKLSKLNQSLLLLNKIENRQFASVHTFDFKNLVAEKMKNWQELWQGRNLRVTADLNSVKISMNEQLADIMLNNLFSNAARHCVQGGEIHLSLSAYVFSISNTGHAGPLDVDKLFKRFSKTGQETDQHGLGLAIIKQIADASDMRVGYTWSNGSHIFSVNFHPVSKDLSVRDHFYSRI